jgi:adenylate cyclase class 2
MVILMIPGKTIEIEVKFRISDQSKIVARLKEVGAKLVNSGFEKNVKFDKGGELKNSGELIRLRHYDGKADITYKKKVKDSSPGHKFQVREEIVLNVDSFELGKKLLEAIGFKPSWRYEKRRQTWEYDGVGILVDEVSIGKFVEIEGPKDKIVEVAGKLGLDMKKSISKSYGELFLDHCQENGLPVQDMVFGEGKK